jgi:AraC-like DNA-binding protein
MNPSEIDVLSFDDQFIINLTTIIEQEISNNELNISYICEKIGLSYSQLNRKIKALTGLSTNHFIRSIRLKRAAQFLSEKTATISEIAYMTGFESLSYFTKKFKEEFHVLPSEYMK